MTTPASYLAPHCVLYENILCVRIAAAKNPEPMLVQPREFTCPMYLIDNLVSLPVFTLM